MKKFFTVPLQVEAESQQEAEQKVNQLLASCPVHKPGIWDMLFVAGLTYLKGKSQLDAILNGPRMPQDAPQQAKEQAGVTG